MKKILLCFVMAAVCTVVSAQTVISRLTKAYKNFENDPQLSNAIASLYVIDAKTGKVIFDKNSRIGLAPASTQKIITAATAYELLGKDFRYKTEFWGGSTLALAEGNSRWNVLNNLFIKGYGDPTLGSWRYNSTKEETVADSLAAAFARNNIQELSNVIYCYQNGFDLVTTSKGWIVEDIGNYYGAGTSAVNWRENQFDVKLYPGKKEGDPVEVDSWVFRTGYEVRYNLLKTGKAGSGDNAYIYFNQQGEMILAGTAESSTGELTISGAAEPAVFLGHRLSQILRSRMKVPYDLWLEIRHDSSRLDVFRDGVKPFPKILIYTHTSPSLDSIIYWFLKRSVNLYGEALTKTLAHQKTGRGETGTGTQIVQNFWKEKGIVPSELNLFDGSGLSPLNRVTTNAQVKILQYAKKQSWFAGYYDAFPEYNGMKIKSGTIGGVKSFCGYHKSKAGQEFIFSFIVNNYNGSSSTLVAKMYKVLDELK